MKKLIIGGGQSFTEAIKNIAIAEKFKIILSKEKCLFVISDVKKASDITIHEADESDKFEKWLFTGETGGTIVVSTDVNSVVLSDSKTKDKLLKLYHTYKNRIFAMKILDKIRRKEDIYAWTIGKYCIGVYTGENGKTFNENSLSINVIGISREKLFKLAQDIREVFNQESVLVQDGATHQVYFVTKD